MTPHDRRSLRRRVLATGLILAAALAGVGGCVADRADPDWPAATDPDPSASSDRQGDVAERGRAVMPFDLDRTTHRFAKTRTGGVQTVVADDPSDTVQIGLVRRHLRDEADRFRVGDFADPTRVHGAAMPGLAELRAGAGRITVDYAATGDGARLTYTTTEPALVSALHAWFDAQVGDHGQHAEHG